MIPQIYIGKKLNEYFNAGMMLGYPSDTPFGNLCLAEMEIFCRIDKINDVLLEIYNDFDKLHQAIKGGMLLLPQRTSRIRFEIEDIVYSLRKLYDQYICISYILGEYAGTGQYPKAVEVDSIGSLLAKIGTTKGNIPSYLVIYEPHKIILKMLNEISNTYKHALVNFETINIIPEAEPSAYWLTMPYNKMANKPALKGTTIKSIVDATNIIFSDIRKDHSSLLSLSKRK